MVELTHEKKSNIIKRTAETTKSAFKKLGKKAGKALIEGLLITALTVNPVFSQVNAKPPAVAQQQTSQQTQLHPDLAKLKTIPFSEVEKAVNRFTTTTKNEFGEEAIDESKNILRTFDYNLKNEKPIFQSGVDIDTKDKAFRGLITIYMTKPGKFFGFSYLDKECLEGKLLRIDLREYPFKVDQKKIDKSVEECTTYVTHIDLAELDRLYQLATGKEMKYVRLGFAQGTDETYGRYIEIHVIPVEKFQGEIKLNIPVLIFTYLIDKGKAYRALCLITSEETTSSK